MIQKEINWEFSYKRFRKQEHESTKKVRKKQYLGQSRSRLNLSPFGQNIDKEKNHCKAQCPPQRIRNPSPHWPPKICCSSPHFPNLTLMNLSVTKFRTSFSSHSLLLFACIMGWKKILNFRLSIWYTSHKQNVEIADECEKYNVVTNHFSY